MTELILNGHNSIGFEIDAEAQRRVEAILKDVDAGNTTVEAEIKKRGEAA